jgi:hypothetical protein
MFTGCNALIGFLQLVAWLLTSNNKCGELDEDTTKAGEVHPLLMHARLGCKCAPLS